MVPGSLRSRLVLLVLIASLPVLVVGVFAAEALRQEQLAEAGRRLQAVLAGSAGDLRFAANQMEALLAALSEVPGVVGGDRGECERVFGRLGAEHAGVFAVVDASGRAVCHSSGRIPAFSFADEPHFRAARETGRFAVGDAVIGRVTGTPLLRTSYPLFDGDGHFRGALLGAIDLRRFGDGNVGSILPPGIHLAFWAADGTILYHAPEGERWIGRRLESGIAHAVLEHAGEPRMVESLDPSGTRMLYAVGGVQGWPASRIAVSVGMSHEAVHAEAQAVFLRSLASFAVIFIGALAAALLLGELGIRRRAGAVVEASRRLAAGDLGARTGLPDAPDELGHLAGAFDRMAEGLERATRTQRVLSQGAKALVRAHNERTLLEDVCRIVVEDGGYRSCWVGYVENDAAGTIRPMAQHGGDLDYLKNLNLTWQDRPGGHSPNALAIRAGAPVVVRDVHTDPVDEAWRRRVLSRGFGSYCALPIVVHGEILGALGIAAAQRGRFEAAEVETLMDLVADMGYGIRALRTRAELDRHAHELENLVDERTSELQRANRFLDSVIENIPDMVFVKDARDLRFVRINRAGEELLGYSRAELIGKADYDFLPPEEADFFVGLDRETLAGGRMVEVAEEPIHTRDRGVRLLHTKKIPVGDEAGRARYVLGISRDITERKAREREILALNAVLARRAAELDAANRELETFSYSVSHDLRAPLRHIQGYVELLAAAAGESLPDKAQRYLSVISSSAVEMGQLIDDLLEFARTARTQMRRGPVDMEALVRDCVRLLGVETNGRRVEWRVGPLPTVGGDAALLKQVWMNLLGNAVKYTRGRDPTVIEVGSRLESLAPAIFFVRDNGVGFDMRHARKLFGVFQRLHRADEFEGTGIGLATAQRIVARHGGRIWAEAAPGHGATFYFTLPDAGEGVQPARGGP